MTQFFVDNFNKRNRCWRCKNAKLKIGNKVYSLCTNHLALARSKWQTWSQDRRAEGKCCYCDRKSFNGWLRCRAHREYNRQQCASWMADHPDHGKQAWAKRKALQDLGLCLYCREHRPMATGRRKCDPCLARQRMLNSVAYKRLSPTKKLKARQQSA